MSLFSNLEILHVRAANIIYNLDWYTPSTEVLAKSKWKTLSAMFKDRLLVLAHKGYYGYLPQSMSPFFTTYISEYDLREKWLL